MYHHPANAKDSRREVLSPSLRAVVGMGLAAVVVPVTMAVVFSYPEFGVGLLAGTLLSYAARNARRVGARLARYDPGAVLRALRPDGLPVHRNERSKVD